MLFVPKGLNVFGVSASVKLSITKEVFSMKDNVKNKVIKKGLQALEKIAEKKANSECYGIIYEPKVPKKLKKTLCLMLASVITAGTLFGGSVSNYYAQDYEYAQWTTIRINPSTSGGSGLTELYVTTREQYKWAVTDYEDPGKDAFVRLDGVNVSLRFVNTTSNTLNKVGSKLFTIYNIRTTEAIPYAQFNTALTCYSYITRFTGYTKIER